MAGLNKVMLIGNLGADPELKFTQSGQGVLNIRLATTEVFFNREKEKQERTEWHRVNVWGNRAEALNKILAKGHKIYVEGRIQTRQWDDKDGNKRYSTEIVATDIVLLGGHKNDNEHGAPRKNDAYPEPGQAGSGVMDDDDIPF